MRTITKVEAQVDDRQFGYWDMDTEQFVPVDAQHADELKRAVAKLGVSAGRIGLTRPTEPAEAESYTDTLNRLFPWGCDTASEIITELARRLQQLEFDQEARRAELAERLADGEDMPLSTFM